MLRRLRVLLCAALLLATPLTAACGAAEAQVFSDISGSSAKGDIADAAAAGWVDGYGDGTFRPDNAVTRAEFAKMLLAAARMTPGSTVANYLAESSDYPIYDPPISYPGDMILKEYLTDMDGHWLDTQGWGKVAMDFGLIISADYAEHRFEPDIPITRNEIAVMTVRILGNVPNAKSAENIELPFSDTADTAGWLWGYIHMARELGVMNGYPDGSFRGGEMATRAQAVTIAARMLRYMEEGIDPEIKLLFARAEGSEPVEIAMTVPAQVVNGEVYVPARDWLTAGRWPDDPDYRARCWWHHIEQELSFEMGGSGSSYSMVSGTKLAGIPGISERSAPFRLLYGEVMVPTISSPSIPRDKGYYLALEPPYSWDPETKTLTYYFSYDIGHLS